MTLSIVARCPETGQFGVAAATAVPAVGKLLSHAYPGAGAVATQAFINPLLGIDGVRLLRDGLSAEEVVDRLKEEDPRIDIRQFAIVDKNGSTAIWTGENCSGWAGAEARSGFSVQGNRLAGAHVLEAFRNSYLGSESASLVDRLIDALASGVDAGGDSRGERSATVYIVADEEYPLWDIRVDDHDEPIGELRRLRAVFEEKLLPHIKEMPTRAHFVGGTGDYDV